MQLDVKLDMQGVREAKQNKQEMLTRLKQLDFDNSGTISIESLLAIANKFNMKISVQDAENIRKYYRKQSVPG
jgi:Ca2+-binding EF-hand superfamily protein